MKWIKKFENSQDDIGKYEDYFTDLSDNWGISVKSKEIKRLLQIILVIKNKELEEGFPLIEPKIFHKDMMIVVHTGDNNGYKKSNLYFKLYLF